MQPTRYCAVRVASPPSAIIAPCRVFCVLSVDSVKKGIFRSISRESERKGSVVYKASTVFNTLVLFNEPLQGELDGKKDKKAFLGYPVVCEVCGNEIGFKHGDDYYLMNMIEEDGACCPLCCNKHSYRRRRLLPPLFFPFFFRFCDACSWMRLISRSVSLLSTQKTAST